MRIYTKYRKNKRHNTHTQEEWNEIQQYLITSTRGLILQRNYNLIKQNNN